MEKHEKAAVGWDPSCVFGKPQTLNLQSKTCKPKTQCPKPYNPSFELQTLSPRNLKPNLECAYGLAASAAAQASDTETEERRLFPNVARRIGGGISEEEKEDDQVVCPHVGPQGGQDFNQTAAMGRHNDSEQCETNQPPKQEQKP